MTLMIDGVEGRVVEPAYCAAVVSEAEEVRLGRWAVLKAKGEFDGDYGCEELEEVD